MSTIVHRWRFSRDHSWAPARMSAYLDSELPSRARARVDRHVEECVECRGVLHSLRRMIGVLHGLSGAGGRPDAPAIAAAVRRRLREPPSR